MTFRRTGVLAVVLSGALALAACGGTTKDNSSSNTAAAAGGSSAAANPNAPLKQGLKITFLPKQVNNPYFAVAQKGAEQAGGKFGAQVKATGPSDASASSQVTYINTAAQQHQDALVMSANDANAVAPALKSARKQGLKVVTFDSDAAADARDIFVNQASTQDIGAGQVKLISDALGGKGEIAILSATPNATNQNAWIAVMKQELAKPEYAGLKLDEIAYGNDDDQTSFQKTQGLLQAHPNLKGIISPTTVGVAAAARYLDSSAYKGKVAAHRARHAEPDAQVRAGRHREVVRVVGPEQARLPRDLRGRGARVRPDHRCAGREVQGGRPRPVHRRREG